ncbi:glycosyltransferase family 2 protein [Odoribacter sp. OttesenSCG-928-L07]|nr:glycosyltransferase family 2 protein [Odoribacter sp. OttesenSCG-928-L07]MDL2238887.1 glycosyltransferase family 2 protein [Bacteroidales bacterium OttesenSCG-928-L14]MDL2240627.1 glycosyltransferase family 2 protein [Bacteroidales bacterium OttesenSCG-928-K22]
MSIENNYSDRNVEKEHVDTKVCIIIPTYNNSKTLAKVIDSVSIYSTHIYVVNDGSTDNTSEILNDYHSKVSIINIEKNRGKGNALKQGFKRAYQDGYDYAISIDSDDQHDAKYIPMFYNGIAKNPHSIIIGSRNLSQENKPTKNTFANKFSNFWFNLQTLSKVKDTQSGYRAYPLKKISKMKLITTRYECELEILVRMAWKNTKIIEIPIEAYYAPKEERVTHFRNVDFLRISLMNTLLTILALTYGYWSMLILKIFKHNG